MMISTKGRYALRIMVDVAQHDGETPVSVREIAQRQDISGKYMEQIISVLTAADFCAVFAALRAVIIWRKIPRYHRRYDFACDGGRSCAG